MTTFIIATVLHLMFVHQGTDAVYVKENCLVDYE